MTVPPSRCPSCGTPTKPNDSFCGACGADLVALEPPPVGKRPAASGPKATMIGLSGNAAPRPEGPTPLANASATPVEREKRGVLLKTMMGMTSPFMPGPPPPLSDPRRDSVPPPAPDAAGAEGSKQSASTGSAEKGAGEASPKRTMLGVAPPPGVVAAIREANANREASAGRPSIRDAVTAAMPSPANAPAAAAPLATAPAATTPAAVPAPAGSGASGASAKRTMVGFGPSPGVAPAPPEPPPAKPAKPEPKPSAPERKVAPKSERTMLGLASVTPSLPNSDEAGRGSSIPDNTSLSFTAPEEPEIAPVAPAGTMRRVFAAIAGALIVLIAFAAAYMMTRGPEVRVRVTQGDDGEQLEIELPSAEAGTKVRFLGAEQELKGGAAKFVLAADSLSLGENELTIGIVRGSEVTSQTVQLHVAYRARVELAGLSRDPPALDVVIDALPGSKVTLDGEPLALDARGHGVKSYPVAPQSGSKLAFSARYRIEPKEGSPNEGDLTLNLPVTSLQIDRPGPKVTTDQSSLEIAGAVEAGAEVLVEGKPVRVQEGRFLHRLPLGKPGDYTVRVLARGQGKAPRALDLQIKRVADLALAAASFKPDATLNYARIAQNPVIYRGQNVAFDGRVYNVEVKGGGSHLQMLVRDCPGTQRCPLWVDLPQDTDVTVDTWVRVLGTVAGEQQFRSERGQVHTVPSVTAQYVLKLAR